MKPKAENNVLSATASTLRHEERTKRQNKWQNTPLFVEKTVSFNQSHWNLHCKEIS
ncbi:Uncharacterised protein [Yersinia rohdei]|uniref:Uncharacterized protein n=1 Tax=Yersinia rohdei TaxID=29485 RepID=A0A0U1HPN2_YERRO|nr:hypothetical protein yrohd0001_26340 [Yersinia rohdei ATCC 43380]CNI31474.1 Uncharacterised protein [Yersinia rohdei]CQI88487.1 Uncharacterised protein [Yersinia rohdei]CQJ47084.1 Uncharacterised protein [Yersinia rohdei]